MSRFDKYMTVPFVDRGRSMSGADCFGLHFLVLLLERQLRVADPGLAFTDKGARDAVAAELARGNWFRVDKPEMYDAVVMKAYFLADGRGESDDRHIGTVIDNGQVLHTEKHTGPRICPLDDLKGRILFFARPAALMKQGLAA